RLGEQRLARAGRTDEQDSLRNATAERGEALGLFQKLDDLLKLGDGFVRASDVGERDPHVLGLHRGRFALAYAEEPRRPSGAGTQASARDRIEEEDDAEREHVAEKDAADRARWALERVLDAGLVELFGQLGIAARCERSRERNGCRSGALQRADD